MVTIKYYTNYADADAAGNANLVAQQQSSFIIKDTAVVTVFMPTEYANTTHWRIARIGIPTGSYQPVPTGLYANGLDLDNLNIPNATTFYIYTEPNPCFLEGTKILCKVNDAETYISIETMRAGTLVKTSLDGYKKVEYIGKGLIHNPGNSERVEQRLYKCSPKNYPGLTEPIYLTGCHSILVDDITPEQNIKLVKQMDRIFVTDNKYRLTAFVDERAEPWASEGSYTIWHFALENEDKKKNYGVYASGLLVETCCIDRIKNNSRLELI
jgi:hypothetical protein